MYTYFFMYFRLKNRKRNHTLDITVIVVKFNFHIRDANHADV